MASSNPSSSILYHKGPPRGIVGAAFVTIFLAGLNPVTMLGVKPASAAPDEPLTAITAFFAERSPAVLLCAALHFDAAIPLGIFTATVVSRLRFLGVRAAGRRHRLVRRVPHRLYHGGFVVGAVGDDLSRRRPERGGPSGFLPMQFALGGPGFSLTFGLLLAGVSVTSGFRGTLPESIVISGLAIAVIGELSWLEPLFPKLLFLIPLTRLPGLAWLIVAGFSLSRSVLKREDH